MIHENYKKFYMKHRAKSPLKNVTRSIFTVKTGEKISICFVLRVFAKRNKLNIK